MHVSPDPSLTVTEPVGAPMPDVAEVTLTVTITELPKVIGPGGVSDLMMVVVLPRTAIAADEPVMDGADVSVAVIV